MVDTIYIYIYIYILRERERERERVYYGYLRAAKTLSLFYNMSIFDFEISLFK